MQGLDLIKVLGGALAATLTFLGSRYAARTSARTTQEGQEQTAAIEASKLFLDRVSKLEERVNNLEMALATEQTLTRQLASFVDRIGYWIAGGCKGPRPTPPMTIHDVIDVSTWVNN